MCIAFVMSGFGISLQNAQANGFVGSIQTNASTNFGFLHASYGEHCGIRVITLKVGGRVTDQCIYLYIVGLGAFAAPLVATYFATVKHWSFHYLISAGIALSNVGFLFLVFRFRNQDGKSSFSLISHQALRSIICFRINP